MSKSFGTEFIIVNSVYQPLLTLSANASNRPYMHLATVRRGFKEYMAYKDPDTLNVWIEEVDYKDPNLLKKIEDDNEWKDISRFLVDAKLLDHRLDGETTVSKSWVDYWKVNEK